MAAEDDMRHARNDFSLQQAWRIEKIVKSKWVSWNLIHIIIYGAPFVWENICFCPFSSLARHIHSLAKNHVCNINHGNYISLSLSHPISALSRAAQSWMSLILLFRSTKSRTMRMTIARNENYCWLAAEKSIAYRWWLSCQCLLFSMGN